MRRQRMMAPRALHAHVVPAAAGHGTVLFSESFENTSFAARGWYDLGGMTSVITTDHAPVAGSNGCLQIAWPLNNQKPSPNTNARVLFTATDSLFLSYWVKHSANWIGSGDLFHPHIFYALSNLDDQFAGPNWNFLNLYTEENYQSSAGGIRAFMQAQDATNIDTTHINVDLTSTTESRAVCGCNGVHDHTTDAPQCFDDGGTPDTWFNAKVWHSASAAIPDAQKTNWHHIEAFWKLNSIVGGIGQFDGVAQYWVDGTNWINETGLIFRTGANPTLKISQLLLAPYIGSGSPAAQTLWLDELTVSTGP